jgi:hypothetical protein
LRIACFSPADGNFATLDADKFSIRTPEQDTAARPGKRVVTALTFEREPVSPR